MSYIKRMMTEYKELLEKCGSLEAFIGGETFKELSETKQELMKEQLIAMDTYAHIVLSRINLEEE